ncbi:helix-turn-helix domain-containing protein [Paenibacillus sp. P46E]|uniref:helix-turn-helix domain-containing protein n=1 Tax=Paenibacillus sp. P46E TaxID=1349436 RepID=UPI00093CE0F6|nr:helix-turn-helix domain-containing protein [Paenibacillus sp. P46E]OKP96766.1 hypothetical protein A3849_19455 [Paenibacillus sp. P46E]
MELYELLVKAHTSDNEAVLSIIKRFKPKIKKSLNQTSPQNRDDLEQDLLTKFIEIIHTYDFDIPEEEV